MSSLPTTIFKYESLSLQSLKNLKAQSVFFASPLKFNDPYDCAITAGVAEPTAGDVEAVRRAYLDRDDVPEAARTQLGSARPGELKDLLMRNMSHTIGVQRDKFLRTNGVCCFSEINNDLLMWAHYGGCYQGMCLEFKTQYEPFNALRKVSYADRMPKIDIRRVSTERDARQFFESLFCTKAHSWAYEREWRSFHAEANVLFTYPAEALKAVYFGPNIDRLALDIVCVILAGQNPDVELWVGRRSDREFKVEFEQKTYTPYIVAKRLGIV